MTRVALVLVILGAGCGSSSSTDAREGRAICAELATRMEQLHDTGPQTRARARAALDGVGDQSMRRIAARAWDTHNTVANLAKDTCLRATPECSSPSLPNDAALVDGTFDAYEMEVKALRGHGPCAAPPAAASARRLCAKISRLLSFPKWLIDPAFTAGLDRVQAGVTFPYSGITEDILQSWRAQLFLAGAVVSTCVDPAIRASCD